MKRIYPVPEAISPGKWTIVPGEQPQVNLKDRVMTLRLDDDPHWRCVRAHELAHVAFTPLNRSKRLPKGVSMLTLQAVEDCRVNYLAMRAGIDFSAGSPEHLIAGTITIQKDNPKNLVLLVLAVFPPEQAGVAERVDASQSNPEIRELISQIAKKAYTDVRRTPTYKQTVKTARWIDAQFADYYAGKAVQGKGSEQPKHETKEGPYYGGMWIETPRLTTKATHSRYHRSTDEGSVFRAPWRVTTDHRVFQRTAVARRASILIDASGSMCLQPEQIRAIVQQAPASVVAAYSGNLADNRGPLRVLASNGRMTAEPTAYHFPGANIIDVPALNWLARQPKPRYWVCDGIVTGLDDRSDPRVDEHCNRIVKSAGIIRVDNADELARRLGGKPCTR